MRGERGETSLIGLLVASTLFLGVLGATLETFSLSERAVRNTGEQADAQAAARTGLDRIARELRSVASPSGAAPQVIDVAGEHDLVVRSADSRVPNAGANTPNLRRVRWCLDGEARLWRAVQTWATAAVPAVPSTASCPGAWSSARVLAQGVVSRDRSLQTFVYDSADPLKVTSVRIALAVDPEPGRGAAATELRSAVYLRNQNRPPTVDFEATVSGAGVITLNGSPSADPDGAPLTFEWKDGATVLPCRSIVCTYDPSGAAAARSLSLTVTDAAGLRAVSPTRTVTA